MIQLLSSRGVPLDYSAKDAESDLETLMKLSWFSWERGIYY